MRLLATGHYDDSDNKKSPANLLRQILDPNGGAAGHIHYKANENVLATTIYGGFRARGKFYAFQ